MSTFLQSVSGADSVMWTPALVILAKATAVVLVALAVTLIMQRTSAVSRHLVLFVSLAALLLIPALGMWSPVRLAILPAAWNTSIGDSATPALGAPSENGSPFYSKVASASRVGTPTSPSFDAGKGKARDVGASPMSLSSIGASISEPSVGVSEATPSGPANANTTVASTGAFDWSRFAVLLLTIWGVVAVALSAWLTLGLVVVQRIVRRATSLEGTPLQSSLIDLADRMSLDDAPRLLISDAITMPFACGIRTPTVVLPREAQSWSDEQRTAVLLHELAHIKRRDLIGHTVSRFACAMYWFHPLVWTAARKLRSESERACDDLALICGARPSDYAEHLLNIVTRVKHRRTPPLALAMATRSEFEGRMLAILDPERRRRGPGRLQSTSLVAAVFVLAVVIGIATPAASSAAMVGVQRSKQVAADSVRHAKSTKPTSVVGVAEASESLAPTDSIPAIETPSAQTKSSRWPDDRALPSSLNADISIRMNTAVNSVMSTRIDTKTNQQVNTYVGGSASPEAGVAMGTLFGGGARVTGDSTERAAILAKVLRTTERTELRRVAAWGLKQYANQPVAVDALISSLDSEDAWTVREMAAWSLSGSYGNVRAVAALSKVAADEKDVPVRETAIWALASIAKTGDAMAVSAFEKASVSADVGVRETAIWGLGTRTRSVATSPTLKFALDDSDARVRTTAAWALKQVGDPAAVPWLDAALRKESNTDVQLAMLRALGSLGEPAMPTIMRLVDDKAPAIREMAIRSLAGNGMHDPWPQPRPRPRPFP